MKILWWDISLISSLDERQHVLRQIALDAPPRASLLLKYSNPKWLSEYLKEVFPHRQVVHGKNRQGDIVIIGMEPNEWITLEQYLKPILPIRKIETVGIYTNIYLGKSFHQEVLKHILNEHAI